MKILNLTKSVQKQLILKNINLKIENRKPLCLMGESGCGKTTLLNIILGKVKPTFGKIEMDGVDTSTRSLYDRNVKFVMQDVALFEYMNVKENIKFGFRDDCKFTESSKEERTLIAAEKLGISHILEAEVSTLSHGQRQRVGLARATVESSNVLVLDEAFNKIDSSRKLLCMKSIKDHVEENNIQLILATHNIEEAIFFDGYIGILDKFECKEFEKVSKAIEDPKSKQLAKIVGLDECKIESLRFHSSSASFRIDNVEYSFPSESISTKLTFNSSVASMFVLQKTIEEKQNGEEKEMFKIVDQWLLNEGKTTILQSKASPSLKLKTNLKINSLCNEYFSVKINKILITEY